MVLIEWRDEFRTGIDGVDHEHEELIAEINAVYASIDAGATRRQLIDRLDDIYGDISAHFALEERIMRRYQYDQYDAHQADHERLLDEIREITEGLETEDELDRDSFRQALADWFQLHFSTHDARLHQMLEHSDDNPVSPPGVRTMIKNAKHRFFGRS